MNIELHCNGKLYAITEPQSILTNCLDGVLADWRELDLTDLADSVWEGETY